MTIPLADICGLWASSDDLKCNIDSFTADDVEDALRAASFIVFQFSGRQWPGVCTETIRPCVRSCLTHLNWRDHTSRRGTFMGTGTWPFWVVCGCSDPVLCSCSSPGLRQISLGVFPVVEIKEIKIDGEVLDPSLYRVDNWKWLVRLPDPDGTLRGWPVSQNMNLPDTEEGTFSVEYCYGNVPPRAGKRAAAALACELLKAGANDSSCKLPQRVQSITRQGISMVVIDPLDLFDEGKTGIPEVDLFVSSVNPAKLRSHSHVLTPDTFTGHRVTDT